MGSPAKPANGVHPALQEYARDVASLVLDSEGNTPLHIVVTKGRLTGVDKLRVSVAMGIKVDVQNRQGVTPLMLAGASPKACLDRQHAACFGSCSPCPWRI